MNDENLIPVTKRSKSEARALSSKGGKASGEVRRRKRDIRLALEALLEKDFTDKHGQTMTGTEAIALKLMEKAMKGDTKAFEIIRDSVGQKPTEKLEVSGLEEQKAKLDELLEQRKQRNAGK